MRGDERAVTCGAGAGAGGVVVTAVTGLGGPTFVSISRRSKGTIFVRAQMLGLSHCCCMTAACSDGNQSINQSRKDTRNNLFERGTTLQQTSRKASK